MKEKILLSFFLFLLSFSVPVLRISQNFQKRTWRQRRTHTRNRKKKPTKRAL